MPFQQAEIRPEKEQEFQQLRQAIDRAFSLPEAERTLKWLTRANIKVRRFELALAAGILDQVGLRQAEELYRSLPLQDQALIREFYLERIERVDSAVRLKYRKVYIDIV